MGTSPASSHRATAVRTARAVAAERIRELKDREHELAEILADYFEAKTGGEKIRADGKDRATRLLKTAEARAVKLKQDAQLAGDQATEKAEKDAAEYDTKVGVAVRRLLEMGETKAGVAKMTGLSQQVIRAIEREHHPPHRPHPPRDQTHT